MGKTLYCVTITSDNGITRTESIWDSHDAAESHLVDDLGFDRLRQVRYADGMGCYERYHGGDEFRNGWKECAQVKEMPLNGCEMTHDDDWTKRHYEPCVSGLSPDERVAYGLSILMTMYKPEEILCVMTREMHKAEADEHDTSVLDDGHVTTIHYLPLMTRWEYSYSGTAVPMHALVIDSDKNKVTFCKDVCDVGGLAYGHKDDARVGALAISDRLLSTVARLMAEWYGEEPVEVRMCDTHDDSADGTGDDGLRQNIVSFDVKMRYGRVDRYEVSRDTLACFVA